MSIADLPIHDRATRTTVDALLRGEALAIWLRGLVPAEQCEHVYQRARAAPLQPLPIHYTREDGGAGYHPNANVLRPPVDVQLDEYFDRLAAARAAPPDARDALVADVMAEYLASVGPSDAFNRALCAPHRRPCELLFEHLDAACGIEVAAFGGRPLKYGTFLLNRRSARYDDPEACPIHVDTVPSVLFPELRAQLGAIVYCHLPRVGGELRIYDHPLIPRDAAIPASVDHGCAYRALKPAAGDAIIINSRRPHAVIPGPDDERLANIMFIGSDGSSPLRIWT